MFGIGDADLLVEMVEPAGSGSLGMLKRESGAGDRDRTDDIQLGKLCISNFSYVIQRVMTLCM